MNALGTRLQFYGNRLCTKEPVDTIQSSVSQEMAHPKDAKHSAACNGMPPQQNLGVIFGKYKPIQKSSLIPDHISTSLSC